MNVRNCHDFSFVMLVFTCQFQTTGNQQTLRKGEGVEEMQLAQLVCYW